MKRTKDDDTLKLELQKANKELHTLITETKKREAELIIANKELLFQNEEKEKRATELSIANKELAYQNKEKRKRAAELGVAKEKLAYQDKEKGKRAFELDIANEELVYQDKEKGKRAAELIIANKELQFQNKEKEKRAAELILANEELAFQNEEKEKRATELVIANKELQFQNEEKQKRADELIIANEELAYQNEEKEKKAAELITVNKDLESFSYSVSHDLRAPIRAINGYSKILVEDYADKLDADGNKVLQSIIKNSKKMGELIDDLLAFSRLGRKEVALTEINMSTLVKTVKEDLIFQKGEKLPDFFIHDLPTAQGDQSLIKQVWINLISNAIKYSQYNPKAIIEIGAYKKDAEMIYYIKDNGAGFDMQYYDKLFGVFQRLHSPVQFEGTGIGLAIVQKIVHRHNGIVWAESKLDEGACFYFTLPVGNTN